MAIHLLNAFKINKGGDHLSPPTHTSCRFPHCWINKCLLPFLSFSSSSSYSSSSVGNGEMVSSWVKRSMFVKQSVFYAPISGQLLILCNLELAKNWLSSCEVFLPHENWRVAARLWWLQVHLIPLITFSSLKVLYPLKIIAGLSLWKLKVAWSRSIKS